MTSTQRAAGFDGETLEIIAFRLHDQEFCVKTTTIRETTAAERVFPASTDAARRSQSLLVSCTWLNWCRIIRRSVMSSSASRMSDSTYRLTAQRFEFSPVGELTLKGITKPVTVPFTYEGSAQDPFGNVRIAVRTWSPSRPSPAVMTR